MLDFDKSMIIVIVFFLFLALVSYPFSVVATKFFLILLEVVLVVGIVKAYLANERVWTVLKLEVAAAALALLAILIWFALRAE